MQIQHGLRALMEKVSGTSITSIRLYRDNGLLLSSPC